VEIVSQVRYVDDVAAQDPEEERVRVGKLTTHTASETCTWEVNGRVRFTLSWPELEALLICAGRRPK
jgi:hypothetical protein